jgi:hypothetical protein
MATLVHGPGVTKPAPRSFLSPGFTKSGSFAMLMAIRRASSRVNS